MKLVFTLSNGFVPRGLRGDELGQHGTMALPIRIPARIADQIDIEAIGWREVNVGKQFPGRIACLRHIQPQQNIPPSKVGLHIARRPPVICPDPQEPNHGAIVALEVLIIDHPTDMNTLAIQPPPVVAAVSESAGVIEEG